MLLINCKIELDLIWSRYCVLSEILRTSITVGNPPTQQTARTSATFQINNAKLYVSVITFSTNDNIKFLENVLQGFKRTISSNKYQSEIVTQTKDNNLDYLIDPTCSNINRLFVLSFKNGNDDSTIDCFDDYKCSARLAFHNSYER